jgi:hypothetical protein
MFLGFLLTQDIAEYLRSEMSSSVSGLTYEKSNQILITHSSCFVQS